MTTTTTYSGVDPSGRSSSRVLRPPGGASNFSLGFGEQQDQPVRKHKMASNIFDPPDDLPAHKPGRESEAEPTVPQRRPLPGGECGDSAEQTGDSEEYENVEADQVIPSDSEVPSEPAPTDSAPAVPAPVPSRRNPPGGRSTLILG
uniref:Hematopoietic-and neurologic-expressed sequence 1 n=1 Tax=Cynops pyrrhogaster TaxID=8330 RepID=Q1XGE5_CYNPY|nr:hematopoietic- and neurologic-expressed sequence 1 [Cynops pyrrhogaster]